ncbi:MAG: HAD-IIIA family hydrolase [Saprospiraceae bacterium]
MNQLETFKGIKTFIFDVDGVMTNSELLILEDGKLLRKMSIRDGYALKMAVNAGYKIAVITGGKSEGVRSRLRALGIVDIYLGYQDKLEAYEEFINAYEINEDTILYMGDDIPDYQVMRRVGFPTCPQNAATEILQLSQYVSPYNGGEGCVRDVIEKVLKLNYQWPIGLGQDEEE